MGEHDQSGTIASDCTDRIPTSATSVDARSLPPSIMLNEYGLKTLVTPERRAEKKAEQAEYGRFNCMKEVGPAL